MFDERHEGDQIIFLALTQFGIDVTDDIQCIKHLSAEVLVGIVIASLKLISDDNNQVCLNSVGTIIIMSKLLNKTY